MAGPNYIWMPIFYNRILVQAHYSYHESYDTGNDNCITEPKTVDIILQNTVVNNRLFKTISVLQACCAVTAEYGIPGDFVKTSTASLQIKISTALVNFLNRNVIIF